VILVGRHQLHTNTGPGPDHAALHPQRTIYGSRERPGLCPGNEQSQSLWLTPSRERNEKMFHLRSISRIALALAAGLALLPTTAASASPRYPILFVHGLEGTGAQFESQALRLTSNGYPASWIDEVDWDSTTGPADQAPVDAQIDAKIAALKKRTGADKVDLVAHSAGTNLSYSYLTDSAHGAERRKNIAHYVNIDGQASNPGVPTLALWAGRRNGTLSANPVTNGTAHMDGAKNITIPNQTHVQTCTSYESFVQIYEFLNGVSPAHDIVRQSGPIQLAGRALTFPQNAGLAGATLKIWLLRDDGHRAASSPDATAHITDGSPGGGGWGPVTVEAGQRYEFELARSSSSTLHFYYEPFVRSDHTLRLLASDALTAYTGNRPSSETAVNLRYKELWGDVPGQNDVLRINGTSICTSDLCPWVKQVNAYFAFDENLNHKTDLTGDPVVGNVPFVAAADVFIPSSPKATGTTTFDLQSRSTGPVRVVKTPNWDSLTDSVIVQWADYEPAEVQTRIASCPSRTIVLRVRAARGEHLLRVVATIGGRPAGHSARSRAVRVRLPGGTARAVTVRLRVTTRKASHVRTRIVRRRVALCANG
jgi:hypothetical protein